MILVRKRGKKGVTYSQLLSVIHKHQCTSSLLYIWHDTSYLMYTMDLLRSGDLLHAYHQVNIL